MLRLLLVDDEQPILDGLKQLIDWERTGVSEIRTAANGQEALDMADSFRPNIVITDIRMPFMDGLQLIKSFRDKLPETKCIILCGYQDFEYARDAIKYGAVRYLVKPVDEDELREIILDLKDSISKTKKERERFEELNRKLLESTPYLRNKLLYSIMTGETKDTAEVEKQLAGFGIGRFPDKFICAVIEFELIEANEGFNSENIELIRFAIANISDELIYSRAAGLVFYMLEKQITVILDMSACQPGTADDLLRGVIHQVARNLNVTVTIGVSNPCSGLKDAPRGYKEARSALKYKLMLGRGKVLYYSEVACNFCNEFILPVSMWKRLENSVITADSAGIPGVIRDLFSDLRSRKLDPSRLLSGCRDELLVIRRNLDEIGLDTGTVSGFIDRFDNEMQNMTLDELEARFTSAFCDIAREVFQSGSSGIRAIISQIRQYIDQNYATEITLNTIAEQFYVNASYASRLFKQELSENFIDYLTNKRMNEAIKLLQTTDLTVYEVSEKIGYGNPKYFSQLFKKHTGFSPRDYRNDILKQVK